VLALRRQREKEKEKKRKKGKKEGADHIQGVAYSLTLPYVPAEQALKEVGG